MKHSRVATNNLMKIIEEDRTDVICIQEPYIIHNKIAGIPRKHKIYTSGEGRHRAAIVVTNNQIDSILLRQLSDEDTVVLEVVSDKAKTIIASMYFDINRQIEGAVDSTTIYIYGPDICLKGLAIWSNSCWTVRKQ
jgi:exonuclease III